MKKVYVSPLMHVESIVLNPVMTATSPTSTLDPTQDTQKVTPTDDEFDDEFSTKGRYHWSTEQDDSDTDGNSFGIW